jgi:DNA-binding NarL/FixJ family response regulator
VRRILGGNASPDRTEETAMHPPISYHLTQARIADLRQHAHRAALAGTAPRVPRRPAVRTEQAPVADSGATPLVLTPRELDVLKLVAQGLTNSGIARLLVLSEHTVHRHLANILRKLKLSSRAAAAAWGVRTGVV